MSETEPIVLPLARGRSKNANSSEPRQDANSRPTPQVVAFNRHELGEILNVYGRQVALGEWRDYAIDMMRDKAVFSIFRRTSEMPIYRIEKSPKLARKQGAYSVISATGLILKRGHELKNVLRTIDKRLKLATA